MGNIQKAVKNVQSQISFEEREEIACNHEKGFRLTGDYICSQYELMINYP
jgi:hypothetical protein